MYSKFQRTTSKIEYLILGCDKNLVDTEKFLANLAREGYGLVPEGKGGEALIINTCAFIHPAKQESIEQILLAVKRKKQGEIKKLVVVGCLVELYQKQLKKEIPEVDLWVKFSELENLPQKIKEIMKPLPRTGFREKLRFITTPSHISYLKISEGCDRACRFCLIPKIRGRFRSIPEKQLVQEAKFLEEKGVKELNLVAQDLAEYGKDIGSNLSKLLEILLKETSIPWFRLFYLNPEGISKELIDLIAQEPRICKYIDLPFQHISDSVLKRMGRRISGKKLYQLIEELRSQVPGLALRATGLVGFPGETQKDFEKLMRFVEWAEFDWLGVFAFSREPMTRAYNLSGQVPAEIVQKRKEELEMLSENLTTEKNSGKIGKCLRVLVDGGSDLGYAFQARGQFQAYEIDGVIHLKGRYKCGEFYDIKILDCLGIDLIGKKRGGKDEEL